MFFLFVHENVCCRYSLAMRLSDACLMSTHDVSFRQQIRKVTIFFLFFIDNSIWKIELDIFVDFLPDHLHEMSSPVFFGN